MKYQTESTDLRISTQVSPTWFASKRFARKWFPSIWTSIITAVIALILLIIVSQPNAISYFIQTQIIDTQVSEGKASLNLAQAFQQAILENFKNHQIFSITTVLILLISSMIHGAAGMGFALFMMPLLVLNGFSLAEASVFTATNGFILSCFMVHKLRKHVQWKLLWPTIIPRAGGLMIGIFILTFLNGLDKALIRQLLGGVLLLTVVIQIAINVKPRDHVHRGWFWSALGLGGILNGLVGFGGPPVVLWVMAHNWSKQQTRAFLAAIYWTIVPIQVLLLVITFGQPLAVFSFQALFFIPIVAVGVLAGVWLGSFMTKPKLRRFVQVLLLITAVWSLAAPYILSNRLV